MTRRLATAAVVGLLLLSVFAGLGGVAAAQDANETEGYTLQELKQDGKHYSVDGARIVPDEQRVYWLEHQPANQPWRDVTKANNGPKFGAGQTLKTNTLYLRTIRAQTSTDAVNVTVVSWDRATRTVTDGNTTKEVAYAANVTSQTQQVSLGPGWSLGAIDIPRHSDTKRVTMWIEGHEDTARWTFKHQSVAFTQSLDADTYAKFVMLSALFVIFPALFTHYYGSKKVKRWIDRAGAPPGHSAAYYTAIALITSGAIVYGIYSFAAEIIVAAPVVLGIGVGVVSMGHTLSTHEGRTSKKLFWQPHIESVSAFASTKIPSIGADDPEKVEFSEDMPFGQMRSFHVLEEGHNGLSIVRDGWMAFLARLKGGRARIENADELRTRFSLWRSGWDEIFIIDPDAETIIDYERPGLRLKMPEFDTWKDLVFPLGVAGGIGMGIWQLFQIYGGPALAGTAIILAYLVWKFAVEGTDSYVRINPAPVAMRPVLASMFVLQMGHRDASSLEEAEEFAWRALAGKEEEQLSWERDRDETFVDETFRSSDGTKNEDQDLSREREKSILDELDDAPAVPDGGEEDDE